MSQNHHFQSGQTIWFVRFFLYEYLYVLLLLPRVNNSLCNMHTGNNIEAKDQAPQKAVIVWLGYSMNIHIGISMHDKKLHQKHWRQACCIDWYIITIWLHLNHQYDCYTTIFIKEWIIISKSNPGDDIILIAISKMGISLFIPFARFEAHMLIKKEIIWNTANKQFCFCFNQEHTRIIQL